MGKSEEGKPVPERAAKVPNPTRSRRAPSVRPTRQEPSSPGTHARGETGTAARPHVVWRLKRVLNRN
jgi:hypothetical protein